MNSTTIAAIATPPGRGGVGIVRVSGPQALIIAERVVGFKPTPRYAHFSKFLDENNEAIDEGLVIFFPNPHSFTGEDVLELQGHGGPVVLQLLLQRVLQCGAVNAKPGEFSERAFLNDKVDLAQAEAIADLINATTLQAAKASMQSLQGKFSDKLQKLYQRMVELRVYVEASIDFPDEDVDFLSDGVVEGKLKNIIDDCASLQQETKQGVILQQGITVVIAGKPNVGKSSLLNLLAARDAAIVTDIAGTTRDVLREYIQIDGIPVHIIDTAGLRETQDVVEQHGIERALDEAKKADKILLLIDDEAEDLLPGATPTNTIIVQNKIDLNNEQPQVCEHKGYTKVKLSAKTGEGLSLLKQTLKESMGLDAPSQDGFIARARHVDAIARSMQALQTGMQQLQQFNAGECLAEELKLAHNSLGEIIGTMSADDLLGEIFSSFCIGK
jgi:tRNA modification GTPase